MELNLTGKRALITGSSQGIGFAIAQSLKNEGCEVILNGRNSERLASAVRQLSGSKSIIGDVTDAHSVGYIIDEIQKKMNGLDILICNVGSGKSVPPGEENQAEWQKIFSTNLWSTTNMVEAARSAFSKAGGSIVCISSICGCEVIPGAPITYSVAKAALHAYVQGIARPLALNKIRINAVAPGNILFDGSVWERKLVENKKAVMSMLKKEVPLGRFGTAEEIAQLVAYLASPKASFATGGIWTLDGGQVHA